MQSIFQTENADKALKYRLYRHLPAYEKIIRNLVSFLIKKIIDVNPLIENIFDFYHIEDALECASRPETYKVIIQFSKEEF